MDIANQLLLKLLEEPAPDRSSLDKCEADLLTPTRLAHLFVGSALLVTTAEYLKQQVWLRAKKDRIQGTSTSYRDLVAPLFNVELIYFSFLKDFIAASGPEKLKAISKLAQGLETEVLSVVRQRPATEQKIFALQALREMSLLFQTEEQNQVGRLPASGHNGLCLYRTFDNLDVMFNLTYSEDKQMTRDHGATERLYQGSGVGVQSGYSTILLALSHVRLEQGDLVIDLGSGYGRVGFVFALLRPDTKFIGYEYIPHRVAAANAASKFFELQNSLSFVTQDLSVASFKIPAAAVYYLYDPFTDETYKTVLKQIGAVSRKSTITIVTKGNARSWLTNIADEHGWPRPTILDEGNLCIFKSA